MTSRSTLAIIGGGFSAASLAVNVHELGLPALDVLLVARNTSGRGVAYSTPFPYHLLNVPAGKMSAFPDQPHHFVSWLQEKKSGVSFSESGEPLEKHFVPRQVFGDYIEDLLERASTPGATGRGVERIEAEAVSLIRDGAKWQLRLSTDATRAVDMVVLATGNEAPAPVLDGLSDEVYLNNPWDWEALRRIATKRSLLLIGTGLTTVDVALMFDSEAEDFKLTAISRRGLSPRAHKWHVPPTSFQLRLDDVDEPDAVFRQMWQHLSRHPEDDWRAIVDSLRPHTQGLWHGWSAEQRRRFREVYAPYWSVRRHRIAPEIAQRIDRMKQDELLDIVNGRIIETVEHEGRLAVTLQQAEPEGELVKLVVDGVINCTGPSSPLANSLHPLFRSLVEQGLVQPDALGLSIDVTEDNEVLDDRSRPARGLWAIGPLSLSAHWEITAVPDIRVQTHALAERLCKLARSE